MVVKKDSADSGNKKLATDPKYSNGNFNRNKKLDQAIIKFTG